MARSGLRQVRRPSARLRSPASPDPPPQQPNPAIPATPAAVELSAAVHSIGRASGRTRRPTQRLLELDRPVVTPRGRSAPRIERIANSQRDLTLTARAITTQLFRRNTIS
jgi:hypothetical protein